MLKPEVVDNLPLGAPSWVYEDIWFSKQKKLKPRVFLLLSAWVIVVFGPLICVFLFLSCVFRFCPGLFSLVPTLLPNATWVLSDTADCQESSRPEVVDQLPLGSPSWVYEDIWSWKQKKSKPRVFLLLSAWVIVVFGLLVCNSRNLPIPSSSESFSVFEELTMIPLHSSHVLVNKVDMHPVSTMQLALKLPRDMQVALPIPAWSKELAVIPSKELAVIPSKELALIPAKELAVIPPKELAVITCCDPVEGVGRDSVEHSRMLSF